MKRQTNRKNFNKAISMLLTVIMLMGILPATMGISDDLTINDPFDAYCDLCELPECDWDCDEPEPCDGTKPGDGTGSTGNPGDSGGSTGNPGDGGGSEQGDGAGIDNKPDSESGDSGETDVPCGCGDLDCDDCETDDDMLIMPFETIGNTLDLSKPPLPGTPVGRFTMNNDGTLTISGTAPVTIVGSNKNNPFSIIVSNATQINLGAGAVIVGTSIAGICALKIDTIAPVTISGLTTPGVVAPTITASSDSDAIYTVDDLTISGVLGDIIAGSCGIKSNKAITISGTIGHITAGHIALHATDITISGTAGNITVTAINGSGIRSEGGTIRISGTVGNITATVFGINADIDITISGTVGDIASTEDDSLAIIAGNITISGNTGKISAAGTNSIAMSTGGSGQIFINAPVTVIGGDRAFNKPPVIGFSPNKITWSEVVNGTLTDNLIDWNIARHVKIESAVEPGKEPSVAVTHNLPAGGLRVGVAIPGNARLVFTASNTTFIDTTVARNFVRDSILDLPPGITAGTPVRAGNRNEVIHVPLSGTPTTAGTSTLRFRMIPAVAFNNQRLFIIPGGVVSIAVAQGTPPALAWPRGLTAISGQRLSDIELPSFAYGRFEWVTPDKPVGAAANSSSFEMRFRQTNSVDWTAIVPGTQTTDTRSVAVRVNRPPAITANDVTARGDREIAIRVNENWEYGISETNSVSDAKWSSERLANTIRLFILLKPDTNYRIFVRLNPDATPSAASPQIRTLSSGANPVQAAPVLNRARVITPNHVELTWTAIETMRYNIYRRVGSGTAELHGATTERGAGIFIDNKDVEPGNTYRYSIRAVGDNGREIGPTSTEVSVRVTAPAPPGSFNVPRGSIRPSEAVFTWRQVAGAAGYEIWLSDRTEPVIVPDSGVRTLRHTVDQLQPNLIYTARIRAYWLPEGVADIEANSSQRVRGAFSRIRSFTTIGPAPGRLAIDRGVDNPPTQVTLTWRAPANANGVVGYRILRDGVVLTESIGVNAFPIFIPANGPQLTKEVPTLGSGIQVRYTVQALWYSGDGAFNPDNPDFANLHPGRMSNTLRVTPPGQAITGLKQVPVDAPLEPFNSIKVEWEEQQPPGPDFELEGYTAELLLNGRWATDMGLLGEPFESNKEATVTFTGLQPDTRYQVRVAPLWRSKSNPQLKFYGTWSRLVNVRTANAPQNTAVTWKSITQVSDGVRLEWELPPANNLNGVTGFAIYRTNVQNAPFTAANVITVNVPVGTARINNGVLPTSWTDFGNETLYLANFINPGTTWRYFIQTMYGDKSDQPGAVSAGNDITITHGAAPGGIQYEVNDGTLSVTWTDLTPDEKGSSFVGYLVELVRRSDGVVDSEIVTDMSNVNKYPVKLRVDPSTDYQIRVRGKWDMFGLGPGGRYGQAGILNFRTPGDTLPAPARLRLAPNGNLSGKEVHIMWNPVTDTGVIGYRIVYTVLVGNHSFEYLKDISINEYKAAGNGYVFISDDSFLTMDRLTGIGARVQFRVMALWEAGFNPDGSIIQGTGRPGDASSNLIVTLPQTFLSTK